MYLQSGIDRCNTGNKRNIESYERIFRQPTLDSLHLS